MCWWYPPNVLMISPDVLMVSPDVLNIPRCTHIITPHASWYSPDVLNIPDVLMISPQCTHGILQCTEHLPMYSWYPPMYSRYPPDVLMISPDVLNTPLPPMYWTHTVEDENVTTTSCIVSFSMERDHLFISQQLPTYFVTLFVTFIWGLERLTFFQGSRSY